MKKLILLIPFMTLPLFAQESALGSDFKTREIAVVASLAHERECSVGKRGPAQELEIDETQERALGLYAGVTSAGDVATMRKDKKEGKTYVTISLCLPENAKIKSVIIPNLNVGSSPNCMVDEIQAMDVMVTLTDGYGVDSDYMKAFRPIDFEESSLCEKKRGLEINDSDPTIALPAKDKESEYEADELKVEQN